MYVYINTVFHHIYITYTSHLYVHINVQVGMPDICRESARRVCSRFYLKAKDKENPDEENEEKSSLTVGKGFNTSLLDEPLLCMLAVQQVSMSHWIHLKKN